MDDGSSQIVKKKSENFARRKLKARPRSRRKSGTKTITIDNNKNNNI